MRCEILSYLRRIGQEHLSEGLDSLSEDGLLRFWQELQGLDDSLLYKQREVLGRDPLCAVAYEPLKAKEEKSECARGLQQLSEGRVGCLILAGGQGTRLGFSAPKGTFPISPVTGKSLFQLALERVGAASHRAGRALPVAIMTSPLNHAETLQFLQEHAWFGLSQTQVQLFAQRMLPFLDNQGNWCLAGAGQIAQGPSGNGEALRGLMQQGIWQQWRDAHVEAVVVIPIDNPLADPFDVELCGLQAAHASEVVIKAVTRLSAEESVGVIVQAEGGIRVIEYFELAQTDEAVHVANINTFCLSMEWIERVALRPVPWHIARKRVPLRHQVAEIYKYETFLFDFLDYAERAHVTLAPREHCYAPLKQAEGAKGIESVKQALLARDRRVFAELFGLPVPQRPFELPARFLYPIDAGNAPEIETGAT